MFSTGVGLVQKGFEEVDWKEIQENTPINLEKPEEEPSTIGLKGKFIGFLDNLFSDEELN
jgi:hypothetical protein